MSYQDRDSLRWECTKLIDLLEREKCDVKRFLQGDLEEAYNKVIAAEIEKISEARRKLDM